MESDPSGVWAALKSAGNLLKHLTSPDLGTVNTLNKLADATAMMSENEGEIIRMMGVLTDAVRNLQARVEQLEQAAQQQREKKPTRKPRRKIGRKGKVPTRRETR